MRTLAALRSWCKISSLWRFRIPFANVPYDQFGDFFCERWALVVVLLHLLIDELA